MSDIAAEAKEIAIEARGEVREARTIIDMHMQHCGEMSTRTANDIHSIREAFHDDRTERKNAQIRIYEKIDGQQRAVLGTLVTVVLMSLAGIIAFIIDKLPG